jgi:ParB family chromosome partitioning protein
MSRKRRMFDIEMPEEPAAEAAGQGAAPETKAARRGPMASAVRENAESLRARSELEARIRAENDALAHEHVRLKRAGLILDMVPVHLVDAEKLVRDRSPKPDEALPELKASILAIGLSNPIRVERKENGRYELIQGWRRLQAYRELEGEHQDGRFTHIPAGYVAAGDALPTSYRRMVDENLIRKDVSFAEMARLAQAYAADPDTECEDVDRAVAALFRSAGYQKRSYIRAFAELLDAIGDALAHPEAIGRNLGLELRKRLEAEPDFAARLRAGLKRSPGRSEAEELAILRAALGAGETSAEGQGAPVAKASPSGRAKTTLRVTTSGGEMKCLASNGRLEIRGATDFSAVDVRRLEAAVAALMDALGLEPGSG